MKLNSSLGFQILEKNRIVFDALTAYSITWWFLMNTVIFSLWFALRSSTDSPFLKCARVGSITRQHYYFSFTRIEANFVPTVPAWKFFLDMLTFFWIWTQGIPLFRLSREKLFAPKSFNQKKMPFWSRLNYWEFYLEIKYLCRKRKRKIVRSRQRKREREREN